VCDEVIVLDFGVLIASGPPDKVRNDPGVIAAYLGDNTDDDLDASAAAIRANAVAVAGGES